MDICLSKNTFLYAEWNHFLYIILSLVLPQGLFQEVPDFWNVFCFCRAIWSACISPPCSFWKSEAKPETYFIKLWHIFLVTCCTSYTPSLMLILFLFYSSIYLCEAGKSTEAKNMSMHSLCIYYKPYQLNYCCCWAKGSI